MKIWEQTKEWMFDDIKRIDNGSVTIVPFQDKVYDAIEFEIEDLSEKQLKNRLNQADNLLNEIIKKRTKTNICETWVDAMNRIDPQRDNYIYIITDGVDNVQGQAKLRQLVNNWCAGKHENVYVFYVMLAESARDEKLIETINACPNIFLIDAARKHLPPFGVFTPSEFTVNAQELHSHKLSFSTSGHYTIEVSTNDSLFSVSVSPIDNGSAVFKVAPIDSKRIEDQLRGKEEYSFCVNLKADPNSLYLITDAIQIKVINKPEAILYVQPETNKMKSKIHHYQKFLFWKANAPDTYCLNLNNVMNNEAKYRKSDVTLKLSSNDKQLNNNDFQLFVYGVACQGNQTTLTGADSNSIIGIVFSDEAAKGKHSFTLSWTSSNKLDRINEDSPKDYTVFLTAKYRTKWNPLAVILTILGILIVTFLLSWFLIIKPSKYPKFKISYLMLTGDSYQNIRLRGARELRFTNGKKKQSTISRLFTGRIIFKDNPFANASDWKVTPRNRKKKKGCRISASSYLLSSGANLTLHETDQTDISYNEKNVHLQIQ